MWTLTVGDDLKDIGFCPIVWDIPLEELERFQYDNPPAIIQHDREGVLHEGFFIA